MGIIGTPKTKFEKYKKNLMKITELKPTYIKRTKII